jgi:hypothetical protein
MRIEGADTMSEHNKSEQAPKNDDIRDGVYG